MASNKLLGIAGVLAIAVAALAWPDDKPKPKNTRSTVEVKDAPAAVQTVVKERAKDAGTTELTRIVRDGKPVYRLDYTTSAGENELTLAESGEIIEDDRSIATGGLPAAIRTAIEARYPGAKLVGAQLSTARSYEVVLMADGKKVEVELLASGHVEDEDEDEDEDEEDDDDDSDSEEGND